MLKVFICEDNDVEKKHFMNIINDIIMIENLDMNVEICTDDPKKLLDYLDENKGCGIYFLDVDLKSEINGIELAEEIRKHDPRGFIIFITTHAEMSYLTFLYKVEAMDYIIKDNYSNMNERIHKCILNANKRYSCKVKSLQKNFTAKLNDKVISIEFDDILFFETSDTIHKVRIHCKNRQIEFYSKIKDIEKKLDDRFYRCHRSYLINKNNIKKIDMEKRLIYMDNDEECLVSTRLIKGLAGYIYKANSC